MSRRLMAVLAAAGFVSSASWAQGGAVPPAPVAAVTAPESGSLSSIPEALLGEALIVSIVASIGMPSEAPAWQASDVKYTIPGGAVSVKMIGRDTVIVITVTPYRSKDGGLLLVAQGQVWYKEGDAGLRYRTTVDTLSVRFGERVLFYPFGAHPEMGAPLRVELVMDEYEPGDGAAAEPRPAGAARPSGAPAPAPGQPAQPGPPAGPAPTAEGNP